jgi:hypothetical protein
MYITTAYLYQQIQSVLMIDTSGNFFDARWRPVYAKNLKLNRGVDNVILFQFQNQDQRPVNIDGITFVFRIISQNGDNLLYSTELVALNNGTGRAKITVPAADSRRLLPQPASWSIESASGNLTQAVFTDDSAGARGTIDIVDSVLPAFVASKILTIPDQAPDEDDRRVSSTIDTAGQSLTTFQLDLQSFSGAVEVQGAASSESATEEWYQIEFDDIATGQVLQVLELSEFTGRRAINVAGFHPALRLRFTGDVADIEQILYR